MKISEGDLEDQFVQKLVGLKYTHRPDIHDRATLEANFRQKFEALNRVRLIDAEFARLLEEIITPDVFTASKTLRDINAFIAIRHLLSQTGADTSKVRQLPEKMSARPSQEEGLAACEPWMNVRCRFGGGFVEGSRP